MLAETPEEVCPKCKGGGWLAHDVLVGDPGFGEAFLCPCQLTEGREEQRRVTFAALPNQKSPKTFDTFHGGGDSRTAAISFARGMLTVLVLQGPHGTGKSHLLEAIGRAMLEDGHLVKYIFVPDWLQMLRATFDGSNTYESVYDIYASGEVLLLDDVGAEKSTDWTRGELTRLFDHRHRNDLKTVVTTNDDEDATIRKQGDRFADRLFDVSSGKVKVVFNTEPSYRTGRVWNPERIRR